MLLNKDSCNILFYNWQKVFLCAQGNPLECFRIFKMLVNKEIPESKYDPIYSYQGIDFSGDSFLMNPDALLFNAYKHTMHDISVYLAIASLRSLNDFINDGIITLELIKSPIDPREHIEDQNLIYVKDDVIHFLYEEISGKEVN